MITQYSLRVYPAGMGRTVYRHIEICGNETLDTLCSFILETFDFDRKHAYEFRMDNRKNSRCAYFGSPDVEEALTKRIELDELELYKGKKFILHYDLDDNWWFWITVSKIIEVSEESRPHLVKSKGDVKQYPFNTDGLDDDEDDEWHRVRDEWDDERDEWDDEREWEDEWDKLYDQGGKWYDKVDKRGERDDDEWDDEWNDKWDDEEVWE